MGQNIRFKIKNRWKAGSDKRNYRYLGLRENTKIGETYIDYVNSEINKNKNTDLVHYSLTYRGSAFYFQKMFISNLFRQSFLKNKLVNNDLILKSGYFDSVRYLNFGSTFQQKYCFMTTINQVRRNLTNSIFNNDSNVIGTFKSLVANNNWFVGNSIYKKTTELRKTYNHKRISWSIVSSINVNLNYFFSSKLPTAKKTLDMKSNYLVPNLSCLFLNKNENEFFKMKELISRSLGSLVFFVRTLWYRLTFKIQLSKLPLNNYDYSSTQKIKIIRSEGYRMLFGSKLKNLIFGTLGLSPI